MKTDAPLQVRKSLMSLRISYLDVSSWICRIETTLLRRFKRVRADRHLGAGGGLIRGPGGLLEQAVVAQHAELMIQRVVRGGVCR